MWFFRIVLIEIYLWYKNQAFLTLKWNFMRQNMLKNLVKREAEGSYLGFWVPKHIYQLNFSTL